MNFNNISPINPKHDMAHYCNNHPFKKAAYIKDNPRMAMNPYLNRVSRRNITPMIQVDE